MNTKTSIATTARELGGEAFIYAPSVRRIYAAKVTDMVGLHSSLIRKVVRENPDVDMSTFIRGYWIPSNGVIAFYPLFVGGRTIPVSSATVNRVISALGARGKVSREIHMTENTEWKNRVLGLVEKALSSKERKKLPDSAFAYIDDEGGRHYPIHDKKHVQAAIAYAKKYQDKTAKKAWPEIKKAAKKHGIDAGKLSESVDEAKDARGVRDGTGPYKDSYAAKKGGKGWRKKLGQKCPVKKDGMKEASIDWNAVKKAAVGAAESIFGKADLEKIDGMIGAAKKKGPGDTEDAVQIVIDMMRS